MSKYRRREEIINSVFRNESFTYGKMGSFLFSFLFSSIENCLLFFNCYSVNEYNIKYGLKHILNIL